MWTPSRRQHRRGRGGCRWEHNSISAKDISNAHIYNTKAGNLRAPINRGHFPQNKIGTKRIFRKPRIWELESFFWKFQNSLICLDPISMDFEILSQIHGFGAPKSMDVGHYFKKQWSLASQIDGFGNRFQKSMDWGVQSP